MTVPLNIHAAEQISARPASSAAVLLRVAGPCSDGPRPHRSARRSCCHTALPRSALPAVSAVLESDGLPSAVDVVGDLAGPQIEQANSGGRGLERSLSRFVGARNDGAGGFTASGCRNQVT